MPNTATQIRTVEERCLNAWPALGEQRVDGWIVRLSQGFTRRANSVQSLDESDESESSPARLAERITQCEAQYGRAGLPTVFKITPLSRPPDLDSALLHADYRLEGETSVQVLDPIPPTATDSTVRLLEAVSPHWLSTFTEFDNTPSMHHPTLRAILDRIAPPNTGALLVDEESPPSGPVCCGRAVSEAGWVGLFDIATHPGRRGRGYATRLIAQLLDWGRRHGATRAYLQVEVDNEAAQRLYRRLGFRELYRYAYRVKP